MLLLPDDADTDLETDRLLGQQRTNDEGYFDDKVVSDLSFLTAIVELTSITSITFQCY